jgi:hypothetical protein
MAQLFRMASSAMVGQIAWENGIDAITVVMMRKKKTARPTSKKASGKAPYKRRRPSLLPRIVVPGAYQRFIGKREMTGLLELAGANTNPQSRRDLVNVLKLAQMDWEDEKNTSSRRRPSPKQIQQLEASIEKTRVLLRRIRRHDDFRNVGFVTQQVGGVVVAAPAQGLPRNPTISDQELIFPHADGGGKVVGINIEPLLRATLLYVRRRRRGRGAPGKLGKEAVVFYTEQFFRRHFPKKPSADPKNPFHEFAERFYQLVTKTEPGGLDRQIRKVLAARRSGQ